MMLWPPLIVLVTMCFVMTGAWITQALTRNAGWVDVFWTFGTGIGGAFCALAPRGAGADVALRQWLIAGCVLVWSLRLGTYIALRVRRSAREDVRYARFRREWGDDFSRRMFRFLIVQAPIAALLDLAVSIAAHAPGHASTSGLHIGDIAAMLLLVVSITGEAIADMQMRRHRHMHAKSVCRDGLWGLSRHPNYLFEWLIWCAYPLVAFSEWPLDDIWPYLSLSAPVLMYWLLVHVSGVPPLEKEMLASRGDLYRLYQAEVPAFFPFPRARSSTRRT